MLRESFDIRPDAKVFKENLRALEVNSPAAAAAARAAGKAPEGLEFALSRSGHLTARYTGADGKTLQLHSAYDPVAEADKWVRTQNFGFGRWVAWLGPGLWYGVASLMGYLFHCPICVIEADPAMLRAALERLPLQNVFANPGLRVITGDAEAMREELRRRPVRIDWHGNMIMFKPAMSMDMDAYADMRLFLEKLTADTPPHADPENVVRREAFGDADPSDVRIIVSTTHRYADAVGRVLAPHGADVRSIYNFESFDLMKEFDPAFLLIFTENLRPGVFMMYQELRGKGVPIVMWNLEDPKFFEDGPLAPVFQETAKLCDYIFTHTRQYIDSYPPLANPARYLPTGARPDMAGGPAPEEEMLYDFSFFGFLNDERMDFFKELTGKLKGLKCRIVGPGLPPEDFRDLIRRTRVNLTVFTTCDLAGEPQWALSDRVWEIPYAGGFLLQDYRKHLDDHFTSEEAVTFSGVDDCAEKIRYYVSHPLERRKILDAARARIRREHLWAHRVEELLKHAGGLMRGSGSG